MTAKTQTAKEKPFLKSEWTENAVEYLQQAGSLILQGALFSIGGIVANKIVSSYSSRHAKKLIEKSSNVVEFSKASKAL